jgi:hypothetical protein
MALVEEERQVAHWKAAVFLLFVWKLLLEQEWGNLSFWMYSIAILF